MLPSVYPYILEYVLQVHAGGTFNAALADYFRCERVRRNCSAYLHICNGTRVKYGTETIKYYLL